MNCTEFEDCIGPFLAGHLDAGFLAAFQTHRDTCPECSAALELDSQLRRTVLADTDADAARLQIGRAHV